MEKHSPTSQASAHSVPLNVTVMKSGSVTCPVCGGTMNRAKGGPKGMPDMVRYKCTCGHCEDRKDDPESVAQSEEAFIEGFQEIP